MMCVPKKILMYGIALMVLTMHTDTMARERGELIKPESDAWLAWTSVEDVLEHRPEQIDKLLAALDLEQEGLDAVRKAVEADDKAAACQALLEYYAGPGCKQWVARMLGEPSAGHVNRADLAVED